MTSVSPDMLLAIGISRFASRFQKKRHLFDHGSPCGCALAVLVTVGSGEADGADNLSFRDEGNSTLHRDCSRQA
jgi:hypothetical protein